VSEKAGFISNSYNLKCSVSQYEELVPSELCKTYEEARKVFKAGSKFVENAVKYYTFDEYVTDFVEIKQVRFLIHCFVLFPSFCQFWASMFFIFFRFLVLYNYIIFLALFFFHFYDTNSELSAMHQAR
jgi:hypothetical protein